MIKILRSCLVPVAILASSGFAASAQTARDPVRDTFAPRQTGGSETPPSEPRSTSGTDSRPTGPFDNQMRKFSAPLSANGAK